VNRKHEVFEQISIAPWAIRFDVAGVKLLFRRDVFIIEVQNQPNQA